MTGDISAAEHPKKKASILGKTMAYVELGDPNGAPILFQHGNPTSSYMWRNVMPHLAGQGRLIAPDLIGMGDSDKLDDSGPDAYRFEDHSRYLDAFIDEVIGNDQKLTLVIHDWGSALGFHWARRNPDRVRGIAYMEAIVRPLIWDEWDEAAAGIFKGFRSEKGEDLILNRNMFIEAVLPSAILRDLTEDEMAVYRRPFGKEGEDRRPTLTWPRQIPIEGEPKDVTEIAEAYADFMATSDIPKLFINAEPGSILTGPQREFCRTWPNQTEVTVKGLHFIQEDSPHEIGAAISDWFAKLP